MTGFGRNTGLSACAMMMRTSVLSSTGSGKIMFLIRHHRWHVTVCAETVRSCANGHFLFLPWLWWIRWEDGMSKSRWDRILPRPCRDTPSQFYLTGANETHSWTCNLHSQSARWVTEDSLWDHEWITLTKVTWKENLILEAVHYEIDVRFAWFSAVLGSVGRVMNEKGSCQPWRESWLFSWLKRRKFYGSTLDWNRFTLSAWTHLVFPYSLVHVRRFENVHHRPFIARDGPFADPRRRQGKGLKKNVMGTRPGDVTRKPFKSLSLSFEFIETQEAQDGEGPKGPWIDIEHSPRAMQLDRVQNWKNFGKSSWTTDFFWSRRNEHKLTFNQKQSSPSSWPWCVKRTLPKTCFLDVKYASGRWQDKKSDYNIQKKITLHFVLRLRGEMQLTFKTIPLDDETSNTNDNVKKQYPETSTRSTTWTRECARSCKSFHRPCSVSAVTDILCTHRMTQDVRVSVSSHPCRS